MSNELSSTKYEKLRLVIIIAGAIGIILACIGANFLLAISTLVLLLSILFNGVVYHRRMRDCRPHHRKPNIFPGRGISTSRGYARIATTDEQADEAAIGANDNDTTHTAVNDDDDDDDDHHGGDLPRWSNRFIALTDLIFAIVFLILHFVDGKVAIEHRRWPGIFAVEVGTVCMFAA